MLCVFFMLSSFALEVDRSEIAPGAATTIEFINYTGPQATISSADEIRGIGSSIGDSLKAQNPNQMQRLGSADRYIFIHAVDPTKTTGFDADILILGEKAQVDHIDNIRRILVGYLTHAYGYETKDANTLATYITIYNAVYRGKLDFFQARYKSVVLDILRQDIVGLSVRYSDWPGKTQIVIPLSDPRLAGTVSSINTSVLTDKAVTEKIKEDTKEGTQLRKDMVELKETEADQAQLRAAKAQEEAAKARITEQQQKADADKASKEALQAQKDAEAAKKEADIAAQKAQAKPEDAKAQETAQAKQQEAEAKKELADKKTEQAEAKKEATQKTQETIAEKEKIAAQDQSLADTKQKEAQTERKEIAADVQKEADQKVQDKKAQEQAALASTNPAYILRVVDDKTFVSELVMVNLNDGQELKKSSLALIRNRTLYDTGSGLMAIAGKKGGNSAVRLVLIDNQTLEMIAQGEDPIAEASLLVQNSHDYYAVIEQSSGNFVLGRFDAKLALKAKSSLNVQAYTAILVTDKGILVQDAKGKIALLKASDLTEIKAK